MHAAAAATGWSSGSRLRLEETFGEFVTWLPPAGHFLAAEQERNQRSRLRGKRAERRRWRIAKRSAGQRSTDAKALCRRRQMSGTATGKRCVELFPISSRPPLRTPPGRFASVQCSGIDRTHIVICSCRLFYADSLNCSLKQSFKLQFRRLLYQAKVVKCRLFLYTVPKLCKKQK